MKQLLLVLTFATTTAIQAQTAFQKAISLPFNQSLSPSCVYSCSDGGFLIGTGSYAYYPNSGAGQALIRTNSSGQVTWAKLLMSDPGSTIIISQAEECSGGYVVFGEYGPAIDSAYVESVCYFLSKLSTTGTVLWTKTYTLPGSSYGHPKMKQLAGGAYLISTSQYQTMGAFQTDSNGNLIWSYSFCGDTSSVAPKNPGFDCALNSDGSMLFSGKSISDIALVKTDINGVIQWTKELTNGFSYYHANSIIPTSDGGYIVAGYQDAEAFLMKLNSTGTQTWYKSFTNASSFDKVMQLPNGEFEVLGQSYDYSNYYYITRSMVARFDSNGNTLNAYQLSDGGTADNYVPYMCLTSTGEVGLAGQENDPYNQGQSMTLFKTNTSGTVPCQFTGFSLQADNITASPAPVAQVPVVRQTQNCTVQNPAFSLITITFAESDFCILFGEQEQHPDVKNVSAYPSPILSGENLQLNVSGIEGTSVISIFDANGKVVKQLNQELSGNQNTTLEISTGDLSAGIYLVRITGTDQQVLGTTKFIVK
ncbi:MAG TPA: T9SS type A sorting domain-containing protein [Bacteroidia bacterium]|nr:T9SS type A sorting domain-containing protein [Bacteroidia bacterium]